jgi:hypothetical protein
MGAIGLIQTMSNSEMDARDRASLSPALHIPSNEPVTALGMHVEKFWQSAYTAKQTIERKMLRALRQRMGVYEPEDLALIRSMGGSEIYMMLTSAKCRGAESWLREILLPETDRPWGLDPTPMPDLPPAVSVAVVEAVTMEAMAAGWDVNDARLDERLLTIKFLALKRLKDLARRIAERHELVIEDQFVEGGFYEALSDCIYDLVTYPAAIMKGPFLRKMKRRAWVPGPAGRWIPMVTEELVPQYERRSPFDIFPAPSMRSVRYGGLIDRYRFTREQLQQMRGVPGYSDDAIDQILEDYGDRGYTSRIMSDTERAILELRPNEMLDHEGTMEAHNYWGSCSGRMLLEWGFTHGIDVEEINNAAVEPYKEYQVEVWKIGRHTFKAMINPDPLGEKPYDKASFDEIPGAFWGQGIPDLMEDLQRMCNASARSIANNMAIASGPQVEINVDRIAPGEPITKPYPWKLWQTTTDFTGNNQPAVRFFQPQANVQELLQIYTHFDGQADTVTGFPKYSYGDSKVAGAGRTSSGLAQLLGNVGKGVRRIIAAVDRGIMRPKVTRTFEHNMEFHPDPTIKGDLRAAPKGTVAVLVKEQAMLRQRELLQATLNPLDSSIIGPRGRAEMLRPMLKNADLPVEKILPDELEMQLLEAVLPPAHELLKGKGPNAPKGPGGGGSGPGEPEGMNGGGGTEEGAETTDAAGQQPNGQGVRSAAGFRDGGVVRSRGGRRFRMTPDGEDGLLVDELDDSQ